MKRTVIINGSPRVNGNTAALIRQLRSDLDGEVVEISAFRAHIAPCVDCRGCWETARCVVEDEMRVLYEDDFDNLVLATPVYFSTLPGKVLDLMSRMQPWHAAMFFLHQPLKQREKKAGLILTGGGRHNEDGATHHIRVLFKLFNAHGFEEHSVYALDTDTMPSWEDTGAIEQTRRLAQWLNADG